LLSNTWWTGAAEPALTVVRGLLERQQRVVMGVPLGSQLERLARKAGVPVLDGLYLDRRLHPWTWLQDLRRLTRFLRENSLDVLHTHLSHDHWLGTCAYGLLGRREKRPIVRIRTVHTLRGTQRLTARWLLRYGADHLITVSRALQHRLVAELRVPRDRVSLIPGAVDGERFRPNSDGARIREEFGLRRDAPLVGIVARIAPSRGHLTLVEAFAQVRAALPQARLLIVGKGEFGSRVEQRVRELALTDAVIFAGYREDDLPAVLAALDLFVLLAPGSEGSCRAALEAMAMGKPVVAGRVGALADIVLHGETGLLVDPHTPPDLAQAICQLLCAPDHARQMGLRGRRRVETCYARERQVGDILALYRQLCTTHAVPSRALVT
jgi:glycosyltransferase involved in cell wall biosynthesis